MEHASSQARHAVHRSGWMASTLATATLLWTIESGWVTNPVGSEPQFGGQLHTAPARREGESVWPRRGGQSPWRVLRFIPPRAVACQALSGTGEAPRVGKAPRVPRQPSAA